MATVTIASVRGLRSWNIYRLFDNFSVMVMVVDNFRLRNRCRWLDVALSSLAAMVMGDLGGWSRTRDSMFHGVNLASSSDLHFWANIHSRAHVTGGSLMTGGAGTHSGKGWSRMTTVACMGTELAAMSLTWLHEVVTLTSLTTSKARRATRAAIATLATIAIGCVSSGRCMAITLVSEATMATMADMTHRTTITRASLVSRLGSTVAKMINLAAMTTLITI